MNGDNIDTRSIVAALTTLGAILIIDSGKIPMLAKLTKTVHLIVIFATLFVSHVIIDALVMAPNKGCRIIDTIMLAVFGLLGYLLYTMVVRQRITDLIKDNTMADIVIAGGFAAVGVFLWKRGFHQILFSQC